MSTAGRVLKRLLVGQPFTNDKLGDTLLPKRIALPVFASDALSSVAYAPDEIFITLSVAGLSAYAFSWKVGLAVAVVMLTIVASYRQNVHAYPSGGGDYEVATTNIGSFAGLTVASALLVDYVLTVAVSVSSGVQNATSALPFINGHEAVVATALVLLLMSVNLRGIRESGSTFAVPTYCFMVAIIGMVIWGLSRHALRPPAARGQREVHHQPRPELRPRAGQRGRRVPDPADLLLGLCGADRCRGDQQRRAGVPQAQEQERRDHAAADGRRSRSRC